jgi:hypothetical protein
MCIFFTIAAALCLSAFGATEYVIVNDNNRYNNSLAVYRLDTTTGSLSQFALLATGGHGSGQDGLSNFVNVEQAISPNAACIFGLDVGRVPTLSDIAAFSKASGYQKVGNYSNSALSEADASGSLALTPNGKFLYASYSETGNIGAWAVNSDCSLSLTGIYSPGAAGAAALKVTPNGAFLVASYGSAELFSINSSDGTLTDIGSLSFSKACPLCGPVRGVDFTRDSKTAVFANTWVSESEVYVPVALSAVISRTGFKQVRAWSLKNSEMLAINNIPLFSAAGFSGSGNLYFGVYGGASFPGVLTANFTENPLNIQVTHATIIDPTIYVGSIAAIGNIMVVAEFPNQIGVFSINQDGSLTELSTTVINNSETGLFSLSAFPDTR